MFSAVVTPKTTFYIYTIPYRATHIHPPPSLPLPDLFLHATEGEQSSESLSRDLAAPHLPSMPVAGRPRSLSSRRRARDSDRALDAETATDTKVVLSGLTLEVPRGRLLGVAGSVGSGKTSLLTGISGQVRRPPSSPALPDR